MTDLVNVTGAVTPEFVAALNENFARIDEKLDTSPTAEAIAAKNTAVEAAGVAVDNAESAIATSSAISALPGADGMTVVTDLDGNILEFMQADGTRRGRFWDPLVANATAGAVAGAVTGYLPGLNGQSVTTDADGNIKRIEQPNGETVEDIDKVSDMPRPDSYHAMAVISDGQSNGEGADNGNAVTTTPTANVRMAAAGIRTTSFGANPFSAIVNAYEANQGSLGETGLVLMGERWFAETGKKLIVNTCGEVGKSIAELLPGASPDYGARVATAVSSFAALSDGEGKSFGVLAGHGIHGEADQGIGTHPEVYIRGWRAKRDYLQAQAEAIGQRHTIPMFMTQLTGYRYESLWNEAPWIGLAQHRLSLIDRRFIVVAPFYIFPHRLATVGTGYDKAHLTNVGYVLMRQYFGIAMKRTLVDRVRWHPLEPRMVAGRAQIERQGKWFIAEFNNPTGTALQFNTTLPDGTSIVDPGDYGFSAVAPDGSAIGLDQANIGIEGNRVFLKADGAIPTFSRLRAGFLGGYNGSGDLTGPVSNSVVCLSDTSTETVTFNPGTGSVEHPLPNYCVHFDFPVLP